MAVAEHPRGQLVAEFQVGVVVIMFFDSAEPFDDQVEGLTAGRAL